MPIMRKMNLINVHFWTYPPYVYSAVCLRELGPYLFNTFIKAVLLFLSFM